MSSISPHVSDAPEWRLPAPGRAALGTRLRVLLHRSRLDGRILGGADVDCDEELALRARQLADPARRRALADSLDHALSIAEGYSRPVSAGPALAARDVRACRAAMLGLSRSLRHDEAVAPAGVLLARRLLTDGGSPLYVESGHDALWRALRRATAVLEGHER